MKLGFLNQDVLENFFSILRGFSYRFNTLSSLQVQGVFRTILINSITEQNAIGSNCKADSAEMLSSLASLLSAQDDEPLPSNYFENDEKEHPAQGAVKTTNFSFTAKKREAIMFARLLFKDEKIKNCKNCQLLFLGNANDNLTNDFNESCMDYFERGYLRSTSIIFNKLPLMCFQRDVATKLLGFLKPKIDFEWVRCPEHIQYVEDNFLLLIIKTCINKWCIHLNKILNGSLMIHGGSIVEVNARQHYLIHNSRSQGMNKQ